MNRIYEEQLLIDNYTICYEYFKKELNLIGEDIQHYEFEYFSILENPETDIKVICLSYLSKKDKTDGYSIEFLLNNENQVIGFSTKIDE